MTADPARRLAAEALGTGALVATVVGSGIMADALRRTTASRSSATPSRRGRSWWCSSPSSARSPALTSIRPSASCSRSAGRSRARRQAHTCSRRSRAGSWGAAGERDVRASPPRDRHQGPQRRGAVALGSRGELRAGRHHPRRPPLPVGGNPLARRALHHRRLLVHGVDSFANPAVAVARAFSNTFAGIRPADVPAFVTAEIVGAVAAAALMHWLLAAPAEEASPAARG